VQPLLVGRAREGEDFTRNPAALPAWVTKTLEQRPGALERVRFAQGTQISGLPCTATSS
jgi:hypothetical protein